jgi:hypothetical protein
MPRLCRHGTVVVQTCSLTHVWVTGLANLGLT